MKRNYIIHFIYKCKPSLIHNFLFRSGLHNINFNITGFYHCVVKGVTNTNISMKYDISRQQSGTYYYYYELLMLNFNVYRVYHKQYLNDKPLPITI